ncbi:MAG TPA: translation initiation factor IF-2 [Candidatus Anoxymicrobiaceae bacterium]
MANTIRVHELATELRKSNREVSDRLRKLQIPAKTNLSSVTQEDANKVRASFGRELVKIVKPKKKAAKKPAAKKPAKKPAAKKATQKAEKPVAKKAAAAKKPEAKKAEKPAAKKPVAKKAAKPVTAAKAVPAKAATKPVAPAEQPAPAKAAQAPAQPRPAAKPATAPARKPIAPQAKAPSGGPAMRPGGPAMRPAGQPAQKAAGAHVPSPRRVAGPPVARPATAERPGQIPKAEPVPQRPARKGKGKQTLRVAPADRRPSERGAPAERKLYRYVPRGRAAPPRTKSAPSTVAPKLLRVPSGITVKDFAQKAGLTPAEVIKKMIGFGEMLTLNQPITDDALRLLSEDLGVEIKIKAARVDEFEEIVEDSEALQPKPPVVTVMGHVDHGKTLLLDAIRKTDVVSSEHGGITQHIGAYQVAFHGKPITFIDTPGHESFTAMRARGAQITDIAVLVVAADDGVMPQTVEALDHALEAEVPVLVAVNKIDKPDSDPGRVRQQLSEKGLIPEEWGGETVFANVSAKTGENIDHLLEMLQLIAELQELKANPDAPASGVVVEAKLDKARGPVATVLVQRGTAKVGDVIAVGSAWGKVRAMFDDKGEAVDAAPPAYPVEILGLSTLPMAGDEFRVVEDEKKARQIADKRRMQKKIEEQGGTPKHVSLENLFDRIKEGELKELKVVLKADTQGSLEAVGDSLAKISRDEVKLHMIHDGVGGITETDIMLADASDAIVLGFNVRPDSKASRLAELEDVDIRTYQVIYKLTEDMEAALVGMLSPIFEEEVIGRLEVRQTFRVPGSGTVAGSYVLEGEINRNSRVRLIREGVVTYDGKVGSLRRFKEDVKSVASGFECGVSLEDFNDIKEGDILEAYKMNEIPRT